MTLMNQRSEIYVRLSHLQREGEEIIMGLAYRGADDHYNDCSGAGGLGGTIQFYTSLWFFDRRHNRYWGSIPIWYGCSAISAD